MSQGDVRQFQLPVGEQVAATQPSVYQKDALSPASVRQVPAYDPNAGLFSQLTTNPFFTAVSIAHYTMAKGSQRLPL